MHVWGAVDLGIYLAKKNHGYSISAQSYDFCPHLIKLDILDFTLSHMFHSEILASLNFNKNKMLSPGLENNHTLKFCSDNFPT